jgi:hypothetical protein
MGNSIVALWKKTEYFTIGLNDLATCVNGESLGISIDVKARLDLSAVIFISAMWCSLSFINQAGLGFE